MDLKRVDGFIQEIIPTYSAALNFIKLIPIKEVVLEINIPFYGEIGKEYIGRFATITSQRTGSEGITLEQKAEGTDWNVETSLPYSDAEELRRDNLDYFFHLNA